MAAGRESLSASRVRVVPRRPFWAVPFNEKEFFYRSRVLRRAQKQAAAADWTGRCPVLVSSEEVAALANRCQQLEWAAAVAHYNVTQLHERVSLLEAAGEMPPLPLSFIFIHFRFSSWWLSIHNNFSTSAAICALGDFVGDRNRVTG